MRIGRDGTGWYLGVDGGTDGGDLLAADCRGPFTQRPEELRRDEEMTVGPSGEHLLLVTHALRAGDETLFVRERFWVSPTDGTRVKLYEVFDTAGKVRQPGYERVEQSGLGDRQRPRHRSGNGAAARAIGSRRHARRL